MPGLMGGPSWPRAVVRVESDLAPICGGSEL